MATDPSEASLYVCVDCGTGVETTGRLEECPECGGPVRNTTVPHD